MRVIVIGLGVQGEKRRQFAGADFVAAVDPIKNDVQYKDVADVPLDSYDAALVCLPDQPKYQVIHYLLEHGKHVLVEKPLWTEKNKELQELERLARANNLVCYTAYNHRFEPHFVRMKQLLDSGELGKIYHCRMFYGNGTARLVRNSVWRDEGLGVLPDLGSHLLDITSYWFSMKPENFKVIAMNTFENRAPDHAVIAKMDCEPQLTFEMTLLSWRNHFTCDVFAEKGSAHIESLCKWGPSRFIHRKRVLPSGRPPEHEVILTQSDPTWATEYAHFKNLVSRGAQADLTTDLWIQQELRRLGEQYFSKTEVIA